MAARWHDCNQPVLALPGGQPPAFRWPIQDWTVLVIPTPAEEANAEGLSYLAHVLLQHGAQIVRVIEPDFSLSVYRAERSVANG